ncbi:MAG TPA: hypothetical protein DDW28_08780 [Prevotella sp.]|nr:hypothetical protein [uncultured Prevotella sp.]HBF06164.1 hypothetical protein [Candidatus Segatella violae]
MKKVINYFSNHQFVFKMILMLLAIVTGGGAMAMADLTETQIGDEGVDPASKATVAEKEPVDKNTSDRLSPGGKKDGQDLTGSQASSTQLREGGLLDKEWDSEIVKFYPFKTPLLSIVRRMAKTVQIKNWNISHQRVGGETLDGQTTAKITEGDTIEINSSNFSGSIRPFYKGTTVFASGVAGYAEGSQEKREGTLMLYVIEANGKKAVMQAVNGKPKTAGDSRINLDNMQCPEIPIGTTFLAGASAASESQLTITPENFQPREKEVYVQKKLLNIVFTDDYEKVKKEQPITVADLKTDAIIKYNLRAERTYLLGCKSRFKAETGDGQIEDVFTSEGIINQLTNTYGIGDEYTLGDMIAISKLQFTEFSENDRCFAFCGKNAIERLENIKLEGSHQNDFINHNEFDLSFKRFKDTFGSIDFVWTQTLDLMGMSDFMVIFDPKASRRYVKIGKKEQTNDMSKGGGEVRDAKRWIHQEADSVALRGYNSILVGPAKKIAQIATESLGAIMSAKTLPETPSKGMKVALTQDYTVKGSNSPTDDKTYEKGTVYYYTGSAWVIYTGQDTAQ